MKKFIMYADSFTVEDQQLFDPESKAYNLLECKKMNLKIPDTLIITQQGFAYYMRYGVISAEIISALQEFIKKNNSNRPAAFAVRCGDKNKHKKLPQTIIHVGITDAYIKFYEKNIVLENLALFYQQIERVKKNVPYEFSWDSCIQERQMSKFDTITQCLYIIELMYQAFHQLMQEGVHLEDNSIIVQPMILTNLDKRSCYGTAYTRNPYTGEEMDYGQYVLSKQGVEANLMPDELWKDMSELETDIPNIYDELKNTLKDIETYYRDIRFVEFVVQSGKLYFTQLSKRNRVYFKEIFDPDPNLSNP